MKKIIYLSILLATLTLSSCSNQDELVQMTDVLLSNTSKVATNDSNSKTYATFDSSTNAQGDPVKPPRD